MKKRAITTIFLIITTLVLTNPILAINLEISSKPISNSVIPDLNEPAVFNFTITNLEDTDDFEIYSLVGIDLKPNTPFTISSGEKKSIIVKAMPQEHLTKTQIPTNFEYKIKNSKNEIQIESLSINLLSLETLLSIEPQTITINSKNIIILIKNRASINIKDITLKSTSAFFDNEQTISLEPKETKEIETPINKEKLKVLSAGNYLMNTKINIDGKKADVESQIKYLEQEGIETLETKEGIIIQRTEIIKKNIGNVKKTIEIKAHKNIFLHLFTTYNIDPFKTKLQDSRVFYTWKKELIPNQELKIIIKTNWFIPIIILIIIIIVIILIRNFLYSDLILRKKVSFVKTKGGQFALKITLHTKAKRFIEKINITDKLPPLVKLYEKFGAIPPDNIDSHNRRLEYNIEHLNKGESRIFTYIIYSRIGVVGRFELPHAKATYEKNNKIKHTTSNRSFYINEPRG